MRRADPHHHAARLPPRAEALPGVASGKNNVERPTLADLTHENATAFAANFRPKDRRAGRYTERNKLVALKALAKWLAEKRLYVVELIEKTVATLDERTTSVVAR